MLHVEITARGASRDVHSGMAPIIPNPIWRLISFLGSLKDEKGEILVPGFYEGVRDLGYDVDRYLEAIPFEEEEVKRDLGIDEFVGGGSGIELLRKLYLSPSLNISGIYGGYTGVGSKTVIPSVAGAKIDIRLVPGQKPEYILAMLEHHMKERASTISA